MAGAALLTAASAQAGVGSDPGGLTLSPASGPATTAGSSITFASTTGCPSGFTGSAVLYALNSDGSIATAASQTIPSVAGAFSGTLAGTPAAIMAQTNVPTGSPSEWAIQCDTDTGGLPDLGSKFVQSTFATINASGTYSSSGTGPVTIQTGTVLTATPNPVVGSGTVTLKAVETATDNTHPAGTVQFFSGSTAINSTGIAVDATGTATTTTTFSGAGPFSLTAVFTSTATGYAGSTSPPVSETITPSGSLTAGGSNPIAISVQVAATGALSVTVAANTGVPLSVSGLVATGNLPNVTVTDTRNTFPGWSVSGTQSTFQGPGTNTISASALGWAPAPVGALTGGASAGPSVSPGTTPGLAAASVLGSAPAGQGNGTNVFTAALTLDIPSSAAAGTYSGTMTITYLSSN